MDQQQQELIWDTLIRDYSKVITNTRIPTTTGAVFIGAKGSGKTSLIHRFSKFSTSDHRTVLPDVEPTPNGMEYFNVRRQLSTVQDGGATVAHLFDAGSGDTAWELFEPVSKRWLTNAVVVVVVDLSKPTSIYSELMSGLRGAHLITSKAVVPRIVVAATKHDRLSDIMDPDHVRKLLDALRCICNDHQSSLISLSLRGSDGGIKAFTSFLRANLFQSTNSTATIPLMPKLLSNCGDYSKPLAISFGTDDLDAIEEPHGGWEVYLSKIFPHTKCPPPSEVERALDGGLEPRIAAIVEREKAQLIGKSKLPS